MKNIIIVGYNDYSKKMIDLIKKEKLFNILTICDDQTSEKKYKEININRIDYISKMNFYDEIFILDDMPYNDDVYYKLNKLNIDEINIIIKEEIEDFSKFPINKIKTYSLKNKPILKYIETHITDKCNLRCNGCSHFSNIFEKDEISYIDFEKSIRDLEKTFDVLVIRLMGGEPLLNKNLHKYINLTRKLFPKSTIFLVTNGLLLPFISQETIQTIVKNNVIINISLYEPTIKNINKIEEFLLQNHIQHRFGNGNTLILDNDIIHKFHTCLNSQKRSENKFVNCYNKYCWFLRKGYIYKCPYPALIYKLNEKYNLDFDYKNDRIKLSDIKYGWEVVENLSKPIEFCKYCTNNIKEYNWSNTNPNLYDYIIN